MGTKLENECAVTMTLGNGTAIHSKLKTGVKSTRKSRVEMLRWLAEPVLATSGSQPQVRWETGIHILTL